MPATSVAGAFFAGGAGCAQTIPQSRKRAVDFMSDIISTGQGTGVGMIADAAGGSARATLLLSELFLWFIVYVTMKWMRLLLGISLTLSILSAQPKRLEFE